MPCIPAVKTTGYKIPAFYRIADHDAAVMIPEFHSVQEHPGLVVIKDIFPGFTAIGGPKDVGRCSDSHDDGRFGVEGFDIPKISFFIARDSDPLPGAATVQGSAYHAVAATNPDYFVAHHAEAAKTAMPAPCQDLDLRGHRLGNYLGEGEGGYGQERETAR